MSKFLKFIFFLACVFSLFYAYFYFNINIFSTYIVFLHKFFFFFFQNILKLFKFCYNIFVYSLVYFWFFLFDQIFFFFIEFLQNPYLLVQRFLKILIGDLYLQLKYFFVLNYYYLFFVSDFWTDKVTWSNLINNYNFWPDDLRFFLIILILCFLLKIIIFLFYFILFYLSPLNFHFLNLVYLNKFFFNFIFCNLKMLFLIFKYYYIIILTNFVNIDKIFLKRYLPFSFRNYFLKIENYLEFIGLLVDYGLLKKKVSKPGYFFFFNNYKLNYFIKHNIFKYSYYPYLIFQYGNNLFTYIIVENFLKKGLIRQQFLYQIVLSLRNELLSLKNIIIPIKENTIKIFFKVDIFLLFPHFLVLKNKSLFFLMKKKTYYFKLLRKQYLSNSFFYTYNLKKK